MIQSNCYKVHVRDNVATDIDAKNLRYCGSEYFSNKIYDMATLALNHASLARNLVNVCKLEVERDKSNPMYDTVRKVVEKCGFWLEESNESELNLIFKEGESIIQLTSELLIESEFRLMNDISYDSTLLLFIVKNTYFVL